MIFNDVLFERVRGPDSQTHKKEGAKPAQENMTHEVKSEQGVNPMGRPL